MARNDPRISTPNSQRGFTLIELVLVLFILGLVLTAVFPKMISFTGGDFKRTSRHLIRTVQLLMDRAAATNRLYRLHYDLESQQYWATVLESSGEFSKADPILVQRVSLRDPIRLDDVTTLRQGKVTEGRAFTQFYPSGLVERTLLHLSKGEDDTVTLIIEPLTGRIKIKEGYVEEQ